MQIIKLFFVSVNLREQKSQKILSFKKYSKKYKKPLDIPKNG